METFKLTAVIGDRTLKVTSDGTKDGTVFEGDERDVKRANATAYNKCLVRLGDIGDSKAIVNAGYDTPLGLAAALYSIEPQSIYLSECPVEVEEFITKNIRLCHSDSIELKRGTSLWRHFIGSILKKKDK